MLIDTTTLVWRLMSAVEGECYGLAISADQAERILSYVLGSGLQSDLAEWAKSIGVHGANHLEKIKDELIELTDRPDDPHEMADVALAVMLHADQRGVDLASACWEKFEIVRSRTYWKPDERGVVRHFPPNADHERPA